MKRKQTPKDRFPYRYLLFFSAISLAFAGLSFIAAPRALTPQISISAFEPFCSTGDSLCLGFADIPFSVGIDCGQEAPELVALVDGQPAPDALGGAYPDYVFNGSFAVGIHELVLQVADSCGQTAAETLSFEVVDCQAPAPVWHTNLTLQLLPNIPATDANGDGTVDPAVVLVLASYFVQQAGSDCTVPVVYSIHKTADILNGTDIPHPEQSDMIFTCSDCYSDIPLRIYAWDSAFNPYSVQPDGTLGGRNYTYHEGYVEVRGDMFGICCEQGVGYSIGGEIKTPIGNPVGSAEITLTGYNTMISHTTNSNGAYLFSNLDYTSDLTLTPYLNDNHGNGVSTADIILIHKQILGVQFLNNPFRLVAADVNNSKTITVQDIIVMRRLILGLIGTFPNNTSWRFLPKNYVVPVPTNPWWEVFPEHIEFNNLSPGVTVADFVAIKIGDVNGTAETN